MAITLANLQTGLLNQSSSQVIDGSLRFDSSKTQYLKRTPGSAGNRKTWTMSWWQKRNSLGVRQFVFEAGNADTTDGRFMIRFSGTSESQLMATRGQAADRLTSAIYRDFSGWAHYVVAVDTTASGNDKIKVYKDGTQIEIGEFSSPTNPGDSADTAVNMAAQHTIGYSHVDSSHPLNSQISQYYLIDGQALGPGYFGFTDPLTGTWRPKKFRAEGTTINDGTQWSSFLSSTGALSFQANGFTGNVSTGAYSSDSSPITFTPPSTIHFQTLRVFTGTGSGTNVVKINGGSNIVMNNNDWTTVSETGGSFSTLTVDNTTGNGTRINAIEVDGVIMVDSTTTNLDFGTNGFYLPMDGNSPIGEDKSGKGNDWTPVNFGGSAGVDQSSGALPILEGAGGAVANVGVRTDAYAANLTLALPLVGNAVDVSNRINSGSTTKTVSVSGDPASSKLQSNFYGASFYFDGSANSDYVSVADNDQLDVGSGDFTIECWAYVSGYPNNNPGLLSKRGGNGAAHWQLALNRNGQIQFGDQATWSNYFGTSSGTTGDQIFKDNWHHIAITRTSGSVQAWYDGRKYGTAITNTTDFSTSANFSVGVGRENNHDPFQGYVNDVRVYKGVAKYTDSFVPASTNPDILPDTPSGVSGGSKLTKITEGAVSFDGNDSLSIADSTDFDFGSNNFCCEFWFYLTTVANDKTFIGNYSGNNAFQVFIGGSGGNKAGMQLRQSGGTYKDVYTTTSIGANRWYHLACVREGSNTKVYLNGKLENTTDFGSGAAIDSNAAMTIGNRTGSTAYGITGFISNLRLVNGSPVYTANFTPPSAPLTNVTNTKLLCCQSNTSANSVAVSPATFSNSGDVYSSGISGSQDNTNGGGSAAAFDGQLGNEDGYGSYPNPGQTLTWTAANSDLGTTLAYSSTIRVYVNVDTNGDDGGLTVVGNNGSQTVDAGSSGGRWVDISAATSPITSIAWSRASSGSQGVTLVAVEVDGSLLIDGFNGKAIQRFYDAAATNFNPFNTSINTVRGQESGYCTLNPLDKSSQTNIVLSNGNLDAANTSSSGQGRVDGTIAFSSGKWYFEGTVTGSSTWHEIGVIKTDQLLAYGIGFYSGGYSYIQTGNKFNNNGDSSYGSSYTTGDTIGVAFDLDNGTLVFYKNGVSQGTAFTGLSGEFTLTLGTYSSAANFGWSSNFGQKPFKFPPPDGFQPLNSANVRPETVISRPDQYVGVKLFSMPNGGSGGTVTLDNDFDMVWTKNRSNNSTNHVLQDSVRGYGDNKNLHPNLTVAQTSTQNITAVNGRTLTIGSNSNYFDNNVAWSWKAGGSKGVFNVDGVDYASFAASGITAGTVTPTGISAGTRQGFSIIKYDGAGTSTSDTPSTIPHGLLQAPSFFIVKAISGDNAADDWFCFHQSLGASKRIRLNKTNTADTQSNLWGNGTAPTSSVISINKGWYSANYTGHTHIMYAWHNVPGLQKFGSYEGNNNANGTFIELGFRPALIWVKNIDADAAWKIIDARLDTYNPSNTSLEINTSGKAFSNAENNTDILSNGFKLRSNHGARNASNTYVYCAWAEAPSFNLYGGQSNAR